MTTVKTVTEHRSILNFNQERLSKSFIRKTLRKAQFDSIITNDDHRSLIVFNHITVGMYDIMMIPENPGKFKNFQVYISEGSVLNTGISISLTRDERFRHQHWLTLNQKSMLTMDHLADVILHCHRLNKLKMFL